jgi:ethanolamine utilization protein EutA (predicted chaperonin)
MPESLQGQPLCRITLREWTTDIEIIADGAVVDAAVMGLGGASLEVAENNVMTAISDNGETFLDAVAKKIKAGDLLEPQMPGLLANLMAETVVNAVARKKPPQISMRLLDSEPLTRFHAARGFLLLFACPKSRMASLFYQSLQESLDDRELAWQEIKD